MRTQSGSHLDFSLVRPWAGHSALSWPDFWPKEKAKILIVCYTTIGKKKKVCCFCLLHLLTISPCDWNSHLSKVQFLRDRIPQTLPKFDLSFGPVCVSPLWSLLLILLKSIPLHLQECFCFVFCDFQSDRLNLFHLFVEFNSKPAVMHTFWRSSETDWFIYSLIHRLFHSTVRMST